MNISTRPSHQPLSTTGAPGQGAQPLAEVAQMPAIRRAGGGLRFLGAVLLFSTLSLLSCQSLIF
ncbi:hypothetical protein [Thiorhodovibrio frisius]|uniref:Uncharacterized protein n=1 Tax=Thiorhodovibrio frisius TaxID=631362 RepID=H8Z4V4_9GAMM|nr:hypothetical protein [Thiorhodovibrio frisius]EIC20361.1 hypothetical protein Thi970DRAFT_03990 [Thiorhodovibrio frisius]WPL21101.1 hypothetical protein Thiofri_01209 [Thiorhodovibrio frisius]